MARSCLMPPEAEEETGEGQGEEARGEAGQPPRLIEVGERFFAVDLDHEPPSRWHDPAGRRERGGGAVVEHLAECVASIGRAPGEGRQGLERAIDRRPPRRVALERGDVGGLGAVRAEEQRLDGAGGHGVVGEEREEASLRPHEQGDHAHGRPRRIDPAVGEHGHAHDQVLVRCLLDEVHVHGAALRRDHGGFGVLPSQLGRPGGARENLSVRIQERDAGIAVGRGDPIELRHDLTTNVHAAATVQHERANGRRGGEDVGVGATALEPVGDETRPAFGDGGDAGLPLGEGGLPLTLDLEPDEGGDERGAEEEG
jgi:hypothetical protein